MPIMLYNKPHRIKALPETRTRCGCVINDFSSFSFRLELNMDLPSAQGAAIGSTASSQASQEQVSLLC